MFYTSCIAMLIKLVLYCIHDCPLHMNHRSSPVWHYCPETPDKYNPTTNQRYMQKKVIINTYMYYANRGGKQIVTQSFAHTGVKRKRCGNCEACQADDCGGCKFCLDKAKFGGLNKLKQSCAKRTCLHNITSHSATPVKGDSVRMLEKVRIHIHSVSIFRARCNTCICVSITQAFCIS